MPASVTVITGPALAGKTTQLLARYRQVLAHGLPGVTLWLAPNERSVVDLRGRLLSDGLPACFSPGIVTFASFAAAVVDAAAEPIRPLTSVMKRHLVHRLVNEAHASGRLRYFAPIAGTTGLVDLVDGWISELKRLEIWPAELRNACQARGLGDKDRDLIELYEAYQHVLNSHNLFDAEGRFWSARALLRGGQTRPFEKLRLVMADGFTDFTRTQHEILEVLAERVDELWISLPLESEPRRDDVFAKTLATLNQLRRSHPRLHIVELPRPAAPSWPAMSHLERELFKSPRHVQPAEETRGIEILAAPRQYGELQLIGKRIKELLTAGREESDGKTVAPGEIAVVFRSLTEVAPLVREVFTELGIPFALEAGRPLNDSPALASLVALLSLARDDWPFRQLLAVLGNSYFQPAWSQWRGGYAAAPAERAIRDLQIPAGRTELLNRLRRRAEPPADQPEVPGADEERAVRKERRRYEAQTALAVLSQLEAAFAQLPQAGTPRQWADAIARLAEETGFLRAIDQAEPGGSHPTRDRISWDRLRDSLWAADNLTQWLDAATAGEQANDTSSLLLNLAEAIELILDILRCEQLPGDHDETGRVRVLSANRARTLSIPYLYFAGLSERAMPAPDREDRLYSDAECRQLRDQGLPLVLRSDRNQEEMLLFYEIVTRATRYLLFSYPALDEKAQPLLASPYLLEAERALGEGKVRRWTEPDLSPVPRNPLPLGPTDARLLAVSQMLDGSPELMAGLIQQFPNGSMVDNLTSGLLVTAQRARRDGFGPHEGLCTSAVAQQWLAEKYGAEHCWSASDLEAYAVCPYRFFMEKILRLEPLPEVTLETNYLERGWVLHAALARLHRQIAVSPALLAAGDFEKAFSEVLGLLVSLDEHDPSLARALREVDLRTLSNWFRNYYLQHQKYDEQWADFEEPLLPAHFEVSFGMQFKSQGVEHDVLSVEAPLVLEQGTESIRFQGRIDRIDVGRLADQPVFNVLDYKSGRAFRRKKDEEFDGTKLQLELYALAVQKLLLANQQAVPLESGYWFVRDSGYRAWLRLYEDQHGQLVPTEAWAAQELKLVETVLALASGVRLGQFPVYSRDEHCTSHCPLKTVCRINQVRSLEKVWSS